MTYRYGDPKVGNTGVVIGIIVTVVIAVLLLFCYAVIPQIAHPFVMILWEHWPGLVILGLAIGTGLLALDRPYIFAPICVVLCILWIVSGIFGSAWRYEAFLDENPPTQLQTEPETTGFRFLPYDVATTTAKNKITDSTVTPGETDPVIENNEASWITVLEPNNGYTSYFGGQPGDLLVKSISNVTPENTVYNPGIGLCCFGRRVPWQNVNNHFWGNYDRAYMTRLNGESVIVVPYETYHFTWHGIIPIEVPQFGGAIVYHPDGTQEDLSPEEAASKYPDGRFYPEELVTYFSNAYPYKDGISNAWFYHRNMPDVPKLSGQDNQFPYLIPTDQGQTWYSAVEPFGSSKSAYMAYYVNATTGKIQTYKFDEPLVGPDRAETFVNNAFPTLKGVSFYEPRPLVKNGKFYWMESASGSGTPDVQFTALVDAYTDDVIRLNSESEVQRVVNGEDPHKVGQVVSGSGDNNGSGSSSSSGSGNNSSTASSSTGSNSSVSGFDPSSFSDDQLIEIIKESANKLTQSK